MTNVMPCLVDSVAHRTDRGTTRHAERDGRRDPPRTAPTRQDTSPSLPACSSRPRHLCMSALAAKVLRLQHDIRVDFTHDGLLHHLVARVHERPGRVVGATTSRRPDLHISFVLQALPPIASCKLTLNRAEKVLRNAGARAPQADKVALLTGLPKNVFPRIIGSDQTGMNAPEEDFHPPPLLHAPFALPALPYDGR